MPYYTYKVTFRDLPGYFYYGKHKCKGSPYYGSPVTWRHLWDFFEPEVQILCWYDTEEEAHSSEQSIIKSTWKSPYSLNENLGGLISERVLKEVGRKNGRKNGPMTFKKNFSPEKCSANGKIQGPIGGKTNGGKNRKKVLCSSTGEVYESTYHASRETGANQASISKCCRGIFQNAGGLKWEYLN